MALAAGSSDPDQPSRLPRPRSPKGIERATSSRALLGVLILWPAPANAVEKLPALGVEIDQTWGLGHLLGSLHG